MVEFVTNVSPFDYWTIAHIVVAFLIGVIGHYSPYDKKYFLIFGLGLVFSWEIIEQIGILSAIKLHPESRINIISDIIFGSIFLPLGIYLDYDKILKR